MPRCTPRRWRGYWRWWGGDDPGSRRCSGVAGHGGDGHAPGDATLQMTLAIDAMLSTSAAVKCTVVGRSSFQTDANAKEIPL